MPSVKWPSWYISMENTTKKAASTTPPAIQSHHSQTPDANHYFFENNETAPIIRSTGIAIFISPMITMTIKMIGRSTKTAAIFETPHAAFNATPIIFPKHPAIKRTNINVSINNSSLVFPQYINSLACHILYYNINLNNYHPPKMPYFAEKFSLKSGMKLRQTITNSNKLVTDYPYSSLTFFRTVFTLPTAFSRTVLPP